MHVRNINLNYKNYNIKKKKLYICVRAGMRVCIYTHKRCVYVYGCACVRSVRECTCVAVKKTCYQCGAYDKSLIRHVQCVGPIGMSLNQYTGVNDFGRGRKTEHKQKVKLQRRGQKA